MNLLILGSTGRTGQQLVNQAIEQGHFVTAFVRDRSKLTLNHERLTVMEGNVLDNDQLAKALAGKDAVLSAIGAGKSLRSNNLISNLVKTLIPTMNSANVKRLIFLSAFGVGKTFIQASWIQKIIFKTFLRNLYTDKSKAEEQIHSSTLDWTLVYPVLLTDKPGTGRYFVNEHLRMKGMPKVSRSDVAEFMLSQLMASTYIKKSPLIMS